MEFFYKDIAIFMIVVMFIVGGIISADRSLSDGLAGVIELIVRILMTLILFIATMVWGAIIGAVYQAKDGFSHFNQIDTSSNKSGDEDDLV